MITKLIAPGSYDFNEPTSQVVEATSRQLAIGDLTKVAGVEEMFGDVSALSIPKNHTVIHVIAVGDGERWGANRNGDSFSREDNKKKHKSFKDIGHVFRNHKNHDPKLKIGDVLATAHNDVMDRIELLLALDNDKCRDEIEKVHKGEDAPVSMGSKQAKDVCSLCGHEAKTAAQHCDHVKYHLGEVAEDGTKIAMLNPDPSYFDISLVFKPADRAAYTLSKLASPQRALGGHELAALAGLVDYDTEKLATMHRVASIIKNQPVKLRPVPEILEDPPKSVLAKTAKVFGGKQLLGWLHKKGMMLSPCDFGEVILEMDDPEKMEAACEEFSRPVEDLIEDGEGPDVLDGECPDPRMEVPEIIENMVVPALSMEDEAVRSRLIRATIAPPVKVAKVRKDIDVAELQGLADMYSHYKLAFINANRGRADRVLNAARTFLLP